MNEYTAGLLSLVAGEATSLGRDRYQRFLAACEADALARHGLVSVNCVRTALTVDGELQIDARACSAMWSRATGRGRPMVRAGGWEPCAGSTSLRAAGRSCASPAHRNTGSAPES